MWKCGREAKKNKWLKLCRLLGHVLNIGMAISGNKRALIIAGPAPQVSGGLQYCYYTRVLGTRLGFLRLVSFHARSPYRCGLSCYTYLLCRGSSK